MKKIIGLMAMMALMAATAPATAQEEEFGFASYYADEFEGRETAYGDTYDRRKMTAAHKRHPYGSTLRVTRLDNKKSVLVKVNDKGPYLKGRVVDLSHAAAEALGIVGEGVVEVKVELVSKRSKETSPASAVAATERPTDYERETVVPTPAPESPREAVVEPAETKRAAPPAAKEEPAPTPTPAPAETAKVPAPKAAALEEKGAPKPRLVGKDYAKYGLYRIILAKPEKGNFGVQIASLANHENMLRQVADLQAKSYNNVHVSIENDGKDGQVYKIILGPFDTEAAAAAYAKTIQRKSRIKGFVVNLSEIKY